MNLNTNRNQIYKEISKQININNQRPIQRIKEKDLQNKIRKVIQN